MVRQTLAGLMLCVQTLFLPATLGYAQSAGAGAEPVATLQPPSAAMREKIDVVHGERLQDDYFWLREKSDPAVAAYLTAENAYAEAFLAHTKDLQQALYDEMLARIKQTDVSVPYKDGGAFHYYRTEEGKQYRIYARRPTLEGPEEITVDLNELAEGKTFVALGEYAVSDDGNLLAYTIDSTGFREYVLYVKDLRTGRILLDRALKVNTVAWAADNRTLFYTTEDHAKRPYRLFRHVLGAEDDELVYEEVDELFRINVERTRSKEYVLLYSSSLTTTEVRALAARSPGGPARETAGAWDASGAAQPPAARDEPGADEWKVVVPRKAGREAYLDHHGERFYIRVNDTGRNFRLVSAPVWHPSEHSWTEVVPHRVDTMLEGMDFFEGHYVLYERRGGVPELRVTDLETGEAHQVSFPEAAYEVFPSTNEEWSTSVFRFAYESLTTPNSIYDYDMDTRERVLRKRTEVLGGYDPEHYRAERIHAVAGDGTRIPISIVYRKGFQRDGRAPLLLIGYGAYGYPYPVTFSSNRVSLLDRGFAVAIAHIRGGGEMGKAWHDQGRMMNKLNTFTDFIAAAEFLVEEKYTSRDRLVIEGGSAGGLLMGAVTNMRPDLFRAVVNHVPFVDVINTMLDASLPLTVTEYEEWGNPNKPEEFAYLRRYSPYDNVAAKEYPAILVKTSLNDSQVMYWEPAKYVAKLRRLKTDANPLLLVTNMGAGHGGASGRYDRLREIALDYAFMLDRVGIDR